MIARFGRLAAATALVVALPLTASAQSTTFSKGDRVVSVGFMTGGDYDGSGVGVQAEWGLLPIGKTTLGIGGFIGYQSDDQGSGAFKASWSALPVMAVANLHFPIESQPKLDLYAGASIGFIRYGWDYAGTLPPGAVKSDTQSAIGFQGGVRYWLGSRFGINGQLGLNDLPLLQAGVSLKF